MPAIAIFARARASVAASLVRDRNMIDDLATEGADHSLAVDIHV